MIMKRATSPTSLITLSAPDREQRILEAIAGVSDPEIPVLSVVDLGVIAGVRCEGDAVIVDMTPTFVGCPAIEMMRADIRQAVESAGARNVTVNVVFDPPWTSDRITAEGRRILKDFGLAPPGPTCGARQTPNLEQTICPYCDSSDTELESLFGPTLCRSIHYCRACLQSFEHFKAI